MTCLNISSLGIVALAAAGVVSASTAITVPDSTRSPIDVAPPKMPPGLAPLSTQDSLTILRGRLELARLMDTLRRIGSAQAMDSTKETRRGRIALKVVDTSLFASHAGAVAPDYPLGPGDVLVLTIWGQKQAQYELEINRDGQIQIPSVGIMSLNGVLFSEAEVLLRHRLRSVYSGLQSGQTNIDLSVKKLRQVRIFVVGEVNRPGGYLLSGATSCLQAIAHAGGPNDVGSERIARVFRGDSSFDVDLYGYLFLGKRPRNDLLRDGDVVQIPPALPNAEATGAVARPGAYELVAGETVVDLLQLAGGIASSANRTSPLRLETLAGSDRVTLHLGAVEKIDEAGGKRRIQPGDILFVPVQGPSKRASPAISGSVRNPGTIPFEPNMNLKRAIALAGGPIAGSNPAQVLRFRTDSAGNVEVQAVTLGDGASNSVLASDSIFVPAPSTRDSAAMVDVSGAVRAPGRYPWHKGMTAADAIALAGGIGPWADTSSIRIELRGSSAPGGVRLSTRSLRSSVSDLLEPFALVAVPTKERMEFPAHVQLTGRFRSPGIFSLAAPNERIASLVQRAGGFDAWAYPEGAFVWRASEGRIPVNLSSAISDAESPDNICLRGGDSIDVPEKPSTISVLGYVNRPTQVLWHPGESWEWYVRSAGNFVDSADQKSVYVQYPDGSIQSIAMSPPPPTPGSWVVVPRTIPPRPVTSTEKVTAFASVVTAIAAVLTVYVLYLRMK